MQGNRFLSVISYLLIFILTSQPLLALDTYVITDDIVFVRPTPEAILPQEQLHGDEAYQKAGDAQYLFYGENVGGTYDSSKPGVIKVLQNTKKYMSGEKGWGEYDININGYIDKSKLWKEPALFQASSTRYQTVKDANVYITPDTKSKQVLALYQGEVVEAVGKINYSGNTWIKARFLSYYYGDGIPVRYGYVKESEVQPLIYESVNESSLTVSEVPKSLRNLNLTFPQKELERLAKDGFFIEPLYGAPYNQIPGNTRNFEGYHNVDDLADYYNGVQSSVFITSDLYLHSFHLIFDRMLQDIEEKKLFPKIKDTSIKLAQQAEQDYKAYHGSNEKIRKALIYNLFFFSVAARLFEPKFVVSETVRLDVDMIIERIYKADKEPLPSLTNPVDLGDEDFSQYKVRGHYLNKIKKREYGSVSTATQENQPQTSQNIQIQTNTTSKKQNTFELYWNKAKNAVKKLLGKKETIAQPDISNSTQQYTINTAMAASTSGSLEIQQAEENSTSLEKYFRGMMWYGRHSLLIKDDTKTLAAILMVGQMQNAGEMQNWQNLDTALTRLMGKTDDWTPSDCRKINEKIFGKPYPTADDIDKIGISSIAKFKEEAKKSLPQQKIVSVQTGLNSSTGDFYNQKERLDITSGFKFLGQRFSWDAYFFGQLTSPSVGSNLDPRNLPNTLDVMSLLDSAAAKKEMALSIQQHSWGGQYYSQLTKLQNELKGELPKKETTYNTWMFTLQSLFEPTQSKQHFAIQEPWQYKNLNTAVSSWTELKHDTIMYMEQNTAELGGEGDFIPPYAPPYVKGYVEPNPILFYRLHELITKLYQDVDNGGFLTDEYRGKLTTLDDLTVKAYEIAKKEVEGKEISKDDYTWMIKMSSYFNLGLLFPNDIYDDYEHPEEKQMALIADISTDAVSGLALEVATGAPQRIFVVVKDAYGGTRITTGYVYSWYQFADNKRWNDNEWKAKVYGGDKDIEKYKPSWYSKIQK